MSKIEVKNIYKIFGPHPEKWEDRDQRVPAVAASVRAGSTA